MAAHCSHWQKLRETAAAANQVRCAVQSGGKWHAVNGMLSSTAQLPCRVHAAYESCCRSARTAGQPCRSSSEQATLLAAVPCRCLSAPGQQLQQCGWAHPAVHHTSQGQLSAPRHAHPHVAEAAGHHRVHFMRLQQPQLHQHLQQAAGACVTLLLAGSLQHVMFLKMLA
jgi:hypothetical protein